MSKRVPLYRLQGNGDHFYTTSASERDNAIAQYGYTSEGIACYVYTDDEAPTPAVTIRDQFAMAAIPTVMYVTGLSADGHLARTNQIATLAYKIADAMIKARA